MALAAGGTSSSSATRSRGSSRRPRPKGGETRLSPFRSADPRASSSLVRAPMWVPNGPQAGPLGAALGSRPPLTWQAPMPSTAEGILRSEVAQLRQALHDRESTLRRAASGEAEAASALAQAEGELQRLSAEEANASRAVAIVQQQTQLRAGQLSEQASRILAM